MFFDMHMYAYSESLFKTLYIGKKHKHFKKDSLRRKKTAQKMSSFFFHEL